MRSRTFKALTIIVAASLMAACAASFSRPVAYGYSTLTAINDSTTASLEQGNVTREKAGEILAISTCIDGVLDSALAVWEAGQEAEAQAQLAIAIALISELQTYEGDWTNERCST